MLFLQPLYEYIYHHYAAHINHFALIKLILYSLDKTNFLFYYLCNYSFMLALIYKTSKDFEIRSMRLAF